MTQPDITNFNKGNVRIIPFGGCGEFGMNMTAYICDDRLYLVDAGISFPDPSKLGVESIFPNLTEWIEQFGGIYAYIITHGHEDHIGALPYMLERWPSPIYATPWTCALIENKLSRRGISSKYPIHKVNPGDKVECEDFSIEFVSFNHSIPDACGLVIRQGTFNIFHTGDFKFDFTPVIEKAVNLKHLEKIGNEGIQLLLADSTNSHLKGYCPSEMSVVEPMEQAFKEAGTGAIVVTTFSSNFWRLKTILDACKKSGRKALILGAGLDNCIKIASSLGISNFDDDLILESNAALSLDRSRLCVIATGSQGEGRSALMRLANGEHRQFSICPGDLIVFSSRTIPGNERVIQYMMSLLERRGARIFSVRNDPNIHVSGHGYREELKDLLKALKPKFFVPVHGTFSHLTSNSKIPQEVGLAQTKSFVIENGDVIDASKSNVLISERIDIDHFFVDSDSYGLLSYETLRERLKIGELGALIVTLAYSQNSSKIVSAPKVQMYGIPSPHNITSDQFKLKILDNLKKYFEHSMRNDKITREEAEEEIRVEIRRFLFQMIKKKPIVVCNLIAV